MSSAQARAIREQQEHIASLAAQRTELHDLLLAVLAASGGMVKVREGAVLAARRQAIVHETEDGFLVVMTEERARERVTSGLMRGLRKWISVGG